MSAAKKNAKQTGDDLLPGDGTREDLVAAMIRVDQAGEFGAARIYAGQLAVLGRNHPASAEIRRMAAQEERHLETFEKIVAERRVRPTALTPLWHVVGFALGATTATLAGSAAMACTVAVEETIDEHYASQAAALEGLPEEGELKAIVEEFRADELEHRDTALAHGAEGAPGYPVLSAAVKAGSRLAIWLSERI